MIKEIVHWLRDTSLDSRKTSWGLLIFRILLCMSLINTHGIKKAVHFEESIAHIPDPLGLGGEFNVYFAIFANVICPIFVMFGWFTRLAILPILSITLLGFFVVHMADPWPVKDVPLMYSLAFSLLLYLGPGQFALDHKNKKL